jgi:hypothetical protein
MDSETFNKYRQERFDPELRGCEYWGIRNDWMYKILQLLVIIFSLMIAAAIALKQFYQMFPGELFALFASLVVSGLASSLKIFNFPGKALYYGKRGDALKSEYYLYLAADGEYSKAEDKEQLFVRRIEVILQRSRDEAESVYYPEFQASHSKEV